MPRMPSGIRAGSVTNVCGTTTDVKAATRKGFRHSSTERRHSMVKKLCTAKFLQGRHRRRATCASAHGTSVQ